MIIDADSLRVAISALSLIGSVGAAIYAWWANRNKRVQREIETLTRDNQKLHERVRLIERDNHYAPSQTDLQKLQATVSALHGDLREMSGRLNGINRAVDNMNNYLLKNDVD